MINMNWSYTNGILWKLKLLKIHLIFQHILYVALYSSPSFPLCSALFTRWVNDEASPPPHQTQDWRQYMILFFCLCLHKSLLISHTAFLQPWLTVHCATLSRPRRRRALGGVVAKVNMQCSTVCSNVYRQKWRTWWVLISPKICANGSLSVAYYIFWVLF